jgi:HK97 gp10 family phage protein
MSARLVGDKELIRAFRKNEKATTQAVENSLIAAGFEIAVEADKNITEKNVIETGNLKRSISPEESKNPEVEKGVEGISVVVGTDVEYAPYHEYGRGPFQVNSAVNIKNVGWRYIGTHPGFPARPFLRPAFDAKKRQAVKIFDKVLRHQLKKI